MPRDAPGHAQPIRLPWVAAASEGDEPGFYTGIGWDAATESLWSETWSCAHACGENIRWVFDGRDFRLALFSVYEGGGIEAMELYRAEVRPPR